MAIVVEGGSPLRGTVKAAGAKNAALPILAATLLADEPCTIGRVPDLDDVRTMLAQLQHLGLSVRPQGQNSLQIQPARYLRTDTPFELASRMRASFLVTGPLLARLGRVQTHLPGGCAIGTRPIDLHIKGLEALGASVSFQGGVLTMTGGPLRGAQIHLDVPSVTATENIMMAAALAQGRTVIGNAAREPEVVDLARFLQRMGARISGAGTGQITIEGRPSLGGGTYRVMADRIETATYLLAGSFPGNHITILDAEPEHLGPVIAKLREAGVSIQTGPQRIEVRGWSRPQGVDVRTLPHPGFPTDVQPPLMALLAVAQGTSTITETIFENRFLHAAELNRMGAAIRVEGPVAIIKGVPQLTGTKVRATDLRAGAALVLAAMAARGRTEIEGVYHIRRGYENLVEKLRGLGAVVYQPGRREAVNRQDTALGQKLQPPSF